MLFCVASSCLFVVHQKYKLKMLKTNLNNLIAKAKLKEAIEIFTQENIKDSDILTGLTSISQSYYTLMKEVINGNIDKDEQARQTNSLTHRLQILISELPDDKPKSAPFRNSPIDDDKAADIRFLNKRPQNHASDMASLGQYMPELDNRVKDLRHYSQPDDMAITSAAVNRVISDVFNPFLKTVNDSIHLSHLADEVNFNEIAFSDELMPATRLMMANMREHPQDVPRYKRNLVISALTLSLVRTFDRSKFYLLADFITDAEPQVWKRALVGLYFALSGREEELDGFVQDKLKRLCANEDVQKSLEDIEIIVKNKEYLLPEKDGNPFSDINNDPFFKALPHNWFMEFRADHPSVKTALKNGDVLNLVHIAPDLPINAFRFAFALNYNQYDAAQKTPIIEKAKTRKSFLEKRYPSVKEREKDRERNECVQYARELYFFYKMYNQEDYKALLEKNISLYDSSLRDILFSDKCQNRISARIDYIEKKYRLVIEKLSVVSDNYSDDLTPRLIGICYLQFSDYKNSLKYFNIAYKIEPTGTLNLTGIGFSYHYEGNHKEALKWYLKAYEIDNNNSLYLSNIGDCHYLNKKFKTALKWYLEAYEIDNKNAWNLNQIGSCYYFSKKYNEALKWFLQAYDIDRNNVWNWKKIADCFDLNKNYVEAEVWLLKIGEAEDDLPF